MALPPLPKPHWINLESTLGCNLECPMCSSHLTGVTKRRRVMSTELLERVEDQVLPGSMDLSLTVAGEPLMTPKLSAFLDLAERQGVSLQLTTNGTLIRDSPQLRRLLRLCSSVTFSVDGASPEVYESIRAGARFHETMERLRIAAAARAELPREERPRFLMSTVLMRDNIHELPALISLCWRLGMDHYAAAYLTAFSEEMDQRSLHHSPERSDAWLRAGARRASELGLSVGLPPPILSSPPRPAPSGQLRRLVTELRGLTLGRVGRQLRELQQHRRLRSWERRAGGRVPCRFLQSQIFISIGGDLAPCPMPGRPVAGNLMEEDFESIWNGPVLTRMREGFLRGEPEPCCQRCSQNPALHQPGSPETVRQELPEAW